MLAGQQFKIEEKLTMKYFINETNKNQTLVRNIVYTEMHFWQENGFNA